MKVLLALACVVPACFAVTSLIVPPIRSSGDEAAIIFVPGAKIKGVAYMETAKAIQKASPLKLWVALTGNYTLEMPNPLQIPTAIEDAIKELKSKGMKSAEYVGIAHSLGGVFLPGYAKSSALKSIVLLGSYLTKGNPLDQYPLPVLTLSGELDGQARITRIVDEYSQLKKMVAKSPDAVYKYPVINIKGTNHAQFASGPMPSEVTKYDLKAEVSNSVAHVLIAKYVSSFLTVSLNKPAASVSQAKQSLQSSYKDSGLRFNPLLKIRALDRNGNVCPWTVEAQKAFAGKNKDKIQVSNKILTNPTFLESKPKIEKDGTVLKVSTTSLLDYELNPIDISTVHSSPKEVDAKLKSGDAIAKALKSAAPNAVKTCKELNQLAINLALNTSTQDAQRRYKSHGRPIVLENDHVFGTGIQWSSTALKIDEDDSGLKVQSIALETSTSSIFYAGMHYCKLLSPFRAMEWINVDSLRTKKPSSITNILG